MVLTLINIEGLISIGLQYEELIRLRAEIAYIKAENEVIKKEIALREEKEAARLNAKKQRLLKRSESKDIN